MSSTSGTLKATFWQLVSQPHCVVYERGRQDQKKHYFHILSSGWTSISHRFPHVNISSQRPRSHFSLGLKFINFTNLLFGKTNQVFTVQQHQFFLGGSVLRHGGLRCRVFPLAIWGLLCASGSVIYAVSSSAPIYLSGSWSLHSFGLCGVLGAVWLCCLVCRSMRVALFYSTVLLHGLLVL